MREIRINGRYLLLGGATLVALALLLPLLGRQMEPPSATLPADVGLVGLPRDARPLPAPKMRLAWARGGHLRQGRQRRHPGRHPRHPKRAPAAPTRDGRAAQSVPASSAPVRAPVGPASAPAPSAGVIYPSPATSSSAPEPSVAEARRLPEPPPRDGSEEFAPR